ncbi:MAG: ribbon-helix-helix protein, CopG family [Actinobacteria bacterium]|nr:ribbon-helix-helix protein, CopG family [Actinomycetota bacterium]
MRTTVTLRDSLYEEAKVAAARRGTSVGSIIEDALASYLARGAEVAEIDLPDLPVTPGSIRQGVDINDASALVDMLDESRAPDALR